MDTRYEETCQSYGILTLKMRRENALKRFVGKALNNPRFRNAWFKPRPEVENDIRNRRPFIENRARTTRYLNSPLVTMQRLANDITTARN